MYDRRQLDRKIEFYKERGICYKHTDTAPILKNTDGTCPVCAALAETAEQRNAAIARARGLHPGKPVV